MAKHTYRVVTRGKDGSIKTRDYDNDEPLLKMHTQVGIDDSSTDLALRGLPVFRGLIGPMPEEKGVVRFVQRIHLLEFPARFEQVLVFL